MARLTLGGGAFGHLNTAQKYHCYQTRGDTPKASYYQRPISKFKRLKEGDRAYFSCFLIYSRGARCDRLHRQYEHESAHEKRAEVYVVRYVGWYQFISRYDKPRNNFVRRDDRYDR